MHLKVGSGQAMLRRPGSSWGFGVLLKGTSVVVLRVESALDIHSPHLQPLPDLRLEPATFRLQVQFSNHSLRHDCPLLFLRVELDTKVVPR